MNIHVVQEDVTQLDVDAIQNAANGLLRHGAGVAGAIGEAGGERLYIESNAVLASHGALEAGTACWTSAGDMANCEYVIHAITMNFPGGRTQPIIVRRCTEATLRIAEALQLNTVAMVALGTGVGGLNLAQCAHTMMDVLGDHPNIGLTDIVFAVHGDDAYRIFDDVVRAGVE